MGLAIFGVRIGQACAWLTRAWVKFSWVAQRCFVTAPSVCRDLNCPPPQVEQNGSDYPWVGLSQPTFRPTFKGSN